MARQAASTAPQVRSVATFEECLLRGRDNPVLFAQDFLDFKCHKGQVAWLLRSGDPHIEEPTLRVAKPFAKQANLHAANRWGKTQIEAVRLLHRAFYQIRPRKYAFDGGKRLKPYVVVNVAMSLDQAMQAHNYAYALAMNSPKFRRFVMDYVGTPFPKIVIGGPGPDGQQIRSEVWARSTAKGARFLLGKSFNFISWDECAFEADGKEILDGVIRMRLVDQEGDLELISAPAGKNWYYEQCRLGHDWVDDEGILHSNPNVYTQRGATFDNVDTETGEPNISFDLTRSNMQTMSADQIKQNVHGEFAETSNVFEVTAIQACYKDQDQKAFWEGDGGKDGMRPDMEWVITGDGENSKYAPQFHRDKHLNYVIGIDCGRKRDQTCIVVLRVPDDRGESAELVFFQLLPIGTPWHTQYDRIQEVCYRYHNCPALIDSTGLGDVVLSDLQNRGLDASGYNFAGGAEKDNLLFHLQAAIQQQRVRFPYIRQLVDQLIYYDWKDRQIATDAVMGLALAWENAIEHGMGGDDEAYQLIVPDVLPAALTRSMEGVLRLVGLLDCPCCNSPLKDAIDQFCLKGFVRENGEIINTVDKLIEVCAMKDPRRQITEDNLKRHAKHLRNEREDEDDEFSELFERKYSARVVTP